MKYLFVEIVVIHLDFSITSFLRVNVMIRKLFRDNEILAVKTNCRTMQKILTCGFRASRHGSSRSCTTPYGVAFMVAPTTRYSHINVILLPQ